MISFDCRIIIVFFEVFELVELFILEFLYLSRIEYLFISSIGRIEDIRPSLRSFYFKSIQQFLIIDRVVGVSHPR